MEKTLIALFLSLSYTRQSDSGFMVPSKPASGARERVLKANEVEIDPEEQWLGYNLKGLRSGSQYVVVVRSSNEAGWSPESRPFVFTTSNAGKYNQPTTTTSNGSEERLSLSRVEQQDKTDAIFARQTNNSS